MDASSLHQAAVFGCLSILASNWNILADKIRHIARAKLTIRPLWPNEEDALSALKEDMPAAWASLRGNKQIDDLEAQVHMGGRVIVLGNIDAPTQLILDWFTASVKASLDRHLEALNVTLKETFMVRIRNGEFGAFPDLWQQACDGILDSVEGTKISPLGNKLLVAMMREIFLLPGGQFSIEEHITAITTIALVATCATHLLACVPQKIDEENGVVSSHDDVLRILHPV